MTDIIVIGGGPAGIAAAIRASQLGAKTTLIERAHVGGNCVNCNCIPLTTILASIELAERIKGAGDMGIKVSEPILDIPTVVARKNQIVDELRSGLQSLLASCGIEVICGEARLIDRRTVVVGDKTIRAETAIVLAPGSQWTELPEDLAGVIRPDVALALEYIPRKLAIAGGGSPEVELATLFAHLGTEVTLVVDGAHPLPQEDYEIGQRLQGIMEGKGISVLTNARIDSAARVDGLLHIVVSQGSSQIELTADHILSADRRPAIDGLGLAEAGVEIRDSAVAVDDCQQTNVAGIYACGDVTGGKMLYSSLATATGIVAAENALGNRRRLDRTVIPRFAFTIPEVAAVGLTEDQALDAGFDVELANVVYGSNPRAIGLGEIEGGIKLVVERKRGKLLGAHIIGYRATELIAEATLAIQMEALAEDFARAIRVHPTFGESLLEAARLALGQALYVPSY